MGQDGPGARLDLRGIDRATRWAGVLLCWAHATAMALTAAEAVLRSTAGWWAVAWAVTAALFVTWVLLRAFQKGPLRLADDSESGGSRPLLPRRIHLLRPRRIASCPQVRPDSRRSVLRAPEPAAKPL